MKKNFLFALVAVMAVFAMTLTSCSSADSKVNELVEQLNSEKFQSFVKSSQVFSSSEAKIVGDSVVELTFQAIPGMTFPENSQALIDAQKAAMINSFKTSLPTDPIFKNGLEGMKEKQMVLHVVYKATDNTSAQVDITPSEVLD